MAESDDPVADFLKREQDDLGELAGIDDEVYNVAVAAAHNTSVEDPATLAVSEPPATMYTETLPTRPVEEPEKIRKWREEQKARLEKKDAEESKKIQEWKAQAKKDLDDWYKTRAEQLENTKKNNRVAEQEFISEHDQELPGKDWERIAKLCDFNQKTTKNTKDVARFRSLLLQMKSGGTDDTK